MSIAVPHLARATFGTLPEDVVSYRSIGPFNRESLPKALLKEHSLKWGTYGLLSVISGNVRFVWDLPDHSKTGQELCAGESIIVPPQAPHHLEMDGAFELEITFFR